MRRINLEPRPDYEAKNSELGLDFDADGYWNEGACYILSPEEVDQIEADTNELYAMAVDYVDTVTEAELALYGFTDEQATFILRSRAEHFSLYGRMDLALRGGRAKLLEFNADTPTGLIEGSLAQWERFKGMTEHYLGSIGTIFHLDQFNSIHEKLLATWRTLPPRTIHFTWARESVEDYRTVEYLAERASEAGHAVKILAIEDVGSDDVDLFDLQDERIRTLFKLYPYEWLFAEDFDITRVGCQFIEPAWKALLSDKVFLVNLWRRHGGHPCLLWSALEAPVAETYVEKPAQGREGRDVIIWKEGRKYGSKAGGHGRTVYQQYVPLDTEIPGLHVVLGSWVVGGEAAGVGFRESRDHVITNTSPFVPHIIQ